MSDSLDDDAPVDTGEDYGTAAPDVDGLEQVGYHVRKIRELRNKRDEIRHAYDVEMARMAKRLDDRMDVINRAIDWHTYPIESWHRAHPADRTIELAHGVLKLTVPKARKVWADDPDAVHRWAVEHHPEILRAPGITDVRRVVQIAEVNGEHVAVDPTTGEVVPGLTVALPDPTWTLTTDAGEPF